MQNKTARDRLLQFQRNEITEYHTYMWLARRIKDQRNRAILERIAGDELGHYGILKRLTGRDVPPRRAKAWQYCLIARLFGLSFGLRLMERGEEIAQKVYGKLKTDIPELAQPLLDEQKHEMDLLALIEEERIAYAGSVVLGLNDALMELTGALAGLTFALPHARLIAMTGFITGVAASMSMAASEYLSAREESDKDERKKPLKSAAYTGCAYILTVLVLISPYLLLRNVYAAAAIMLALNLLIILAYNFYIATAKGLRLWRRFGQMALISLGVAGLSFLVGMLAQKLFGAAI